MRNGHIIQIFGLINSSDVLNVESRVLFFFLINLYILISKGILIKQPKNPEHKMKGTTSRADLTLNWTHHDSDLPDFYFRTIQKENVEQVSEFLLKYFFAEEPLGQSLKLDPNKEVRPWLSKMLEHEIREGLSV